MTITPNSGPGHVLLAGLAAAALVCSVFLGRAAPTAAQSGSPTDGQELPAIAVSMSALPVRGETITLTFEGFDASLEQSQATDGRLSVTRLYKGLCHIEQTYTGRNNLGQEVANVPFSRAGWRNLGAVMPVSGFALQISYPDYSPDCFMAFFRYGQSDGTNQLTEPLLFRVDWRQPALIPLDAEERAPLEQIRTRTPGGSLMVLFLTPIILFGVLFFSVSKVKKFQQFAVYIGLGAATLGLGGAIVLLDINNFALLLLLIPPAIGFGIGRASR